MVEESVLPLAQALGPEPRIRRPFQPLGRSEGRSDGVIDILFCGVLRIADRLLRVRIDVRNRRGSSRIAHPPIDHEAGIEFTLVQDPHPFLGVCRLKLPIHRSDSTARTATPPANPPSTQSS